LGIPRTPEPDRNSAQGGRSFYFFDFDDNIAFLTTPTFLYHRESGAEIEISSRELAEQGGQIGKSGTYADYEFQYDGPQNSFRCFRDKDMSLIERLLGRRQIFVKDLAGILGLPDANWKGPSWNCFYHAVFNGRPLALITARGHHPRTIRQGISLWVGEGHLPYEPNYLGIYPVNHPEVKKQLGLPGSDSVPHLKQLALRAAVLSAVEQYGHNPHHRFGMSDDDPRNIEWIVSEMRVLKREFSQMSFFIIQTHGDQMTKIEIFEDHLQDRELGPTRLLQGPTQLDLFEK
jgi:hypothetical protein